MSGRAATFVSEMSPDPFTGALDPHEVRVTLLDLSPDPPRDGWVARVWIEDGTDAEGVEVVCRASDTVRCSAGLDAQSIERKVADHINLIPHPEHRLAIVRARAELNGEYRLDGDADVGLYVTEPPIPVPAS